MARLLFRPACWITLALILAACSSADPPSSSVTVSASAGNGGSITPSTVSVAKNSTATFNVSPSANYVVDTVTGCNGSLAGNTYTTGRLTSDCNVVASFKLKTYTVTLNTGADGTATPASQSAQHGSTVSFVVRPRTGLDIDSVSTTAPAGTCPAVVSGSNVNVGPVTGDCGIEVKFKPLTVRLTYVSSNGISLVGPATASYNDRISVAVNRPRGSEFMVSGVTASSGGCSIAAPSTPGGAYSVGPLTADCTITVSSQRLAGYVLLSTRVGLAINSLNLSSLLSLSPRPSTYTLAHPPQNGTTIVAASGVTNFTPNLSFLGNDEFVVRATTAAGDIGIGVKVRTFSVAPSNVSFFGPQTPALVTNSLSTDVVATAGDGSLVVADLNGDGRRDIALLLENTTSPNVGSVTVVSNPGASYPTFGATARLNLPAAFGALSLHAREMNGDGSPELLVTGSAGRISVFINNGATFNPASADTVTLQGNVSAILSSSLGDFNADGRQDLAFVRTATPRVAVLLGSASPIAGGSAGFSSAPQVVSGSSTRFVATFPGNAASPPRIDLIGSDAASPSVIERFTNAGAVGQFTGPATTSSLGNFSWRPVVGDLNGDGVPDIVFVNRDSSTMTVIFGTASGGISLAHVIETRLSSANRASIADLNADGYADILISGADGFTQFLGMGEGYFFDPSFIPYVPSAGFPINDSAVLDIDADGRPDVVTVEPSTTGPVLKFFRNLP